jgi:hypothetical protein
MSTREDSGRKVFRSQSGLLLVAADVPDNTRSREGDLSTPDSRPFPQANISKQLKVPPPIKPKPKHLL